MNKDIIELMKHGLTASQAIDYLETVSKQTVMNSLIAPNSSVMSLLTPLDAPPVLIAEPEPEPPTVQQPLPEPEDVLPPSNSKLYISESKLYLITLKNKKCWLTASIKPLRHMLNVTHSDLKNVYKKDENSPVYQALCSSKLKSIEFISSWDSDQSHEEIHSKMREKHGSNYIQMRIRPRKPTKSIFDSVDIFIDTRISQNIRSFSKEEMSCLISRSGSSPNNIQHKLQKFGFKLRP